MDEKPWQKKMLSPTSQRFWCDKSRVEPEAMLMLLDWRSHFENHRPTWPEHMPALPESLFTSFWSELSDPLFWTNASHTPPCWKLAAPRVICLLPDFKMLLFLVEFFCGRPEARNISPKDWIWPLVQFQTLSKQKRRGTLIMWKLCEKSRCIHYMWYQPVPINYFLWNLYLYWQWKWIAQGIFIRKWRSEETDLSVFVLAFMKYGQLWRNMTG